MTRITIKPAFLAIAVVALLASGLTGGYWWARHGAGQAMQMPARGAGSTSEPAVLYWYDPMVPDQHFDKPGKSPFMDMQLVPKYADNRSAAGARIAPGTRQNLGIRTAVVETGTLAMGIRVPGTLSWNLREESVVGARVAGVVTRLLVKTPFETVRRGQALATILAPEWSGALAEAQALDGAHSDTARGLRDAARRRLRVLGANGRSADGAVVLGAPGDGVVSEILVREGQPVMAGSPLFRINGTATLWLEAAIPQGAVADIRHGTRVEASVDAVPGEIFEGEVEALLPQIDAASRTQRARIVLRNPDGLLGPGMFAQLLLQPEAGPPMPLVPNEALIATGDDSRVIVLGSDGAFEPVRVRTGRSAGGKTEVLAGLKGGEKIVVSGQFLIDSEASLSGALQRLQAPQAPAQEPPR
jgi:Cu(I)/Ag(I) efflux system membrane fusion protein